MKATALLILYNTTATQIHHHNETWPLTSKITSKWQQSKTQFFLAHFLHSSRFTTGNGSSSGASAGSAGSSFGAASGASPTGSGSAEGVGIGVAPSLVMPAVVRAIHCFTLHQMGWIMMVRKKSENWWSSYSLVFAFGIPDSGDSLSNKNQATSSTKYPLGNWKGHGISVKFAEQMRMWWAWFSGDTYLRVLHGSNFNISP